MASPLTMANGISTCRGWSAASDPVASEPGLSDELSTTRCRSGFAAFLAIRGQSSIHTQVHGAAHIIERRSSGLTRLFRAFGDDVAHGIRILLEFNRPLADSADFLDHLVDERLLAFEAADTGGPAPDGGPGACLLARIDLVQIEHRALLGFARIGTAHPRRIRLHLLELFHDFVGVLAQADRVAVRLRHLAAVEPRHLRRRREQHLWLGQDADRAALEIT